MRRTPTAFSARPIAARRIINPLSVEFSTSGLVKVSPGASIGAWPGANDPIAVPFRLSDGATIQQLGWFNGSSAGGNVDIGVYDAALNLLVAAGSTAGSGNNAWQFVDVTDTPLTADLVYYLTLVRDNTTANRQRYFNVGASALSLALAGVLDSTTAAFALPSSLTAAAASVFTSLPMMAIAFRAPF